MDAEISRHMTEIQNELKVLRLNLSKSASAKEFQQKDTTAGPLSSEDDDELVFLPIQSPRPLCPCIPISRSPASPKSPKSATSHAQFPTQPSHPFQPHMHNVPPTSCRPSQTQSHTQDYISHLLQENISLRKRLHEQEYHSMVVRSGLEKRIARVENRYRVMRELCDGKVRKAGARDVERTVGGWCRGCGGDVR